MDSAVNDLQTEWARLIVGAFADVGVRDVVLSPGSRAGPFVLAAAAHPRLRLHTIIDERAAGFFALGQARITGTPSLLMCTSGSAPSHYLPAVVEARYANVPLLVLSADRPPESQYSGARQVIDQTRLFGEHALAYFDLGVVDPFVGSARGTRRLIAQAAALSLGSNGGAVHLNVRARRPFEPSMPQTPSEAKSAVEMRALAATPVLEISVPRLLPAVGPLRELARRIAEEPNGLLALGFAPVGEVDVALSQAIVALAERSGYPVLMQPTSIGTYASSPLLLRGAVSLMMASPQARAAFCPRLVIQMGPELASSNYDLLLNTPARPRVEILSVTPEVDAGNTANRIHVGELRLCLEALIAELDAIGIQRRSSTWAERLLKAEGVVNGAVAAYLSDKPRHELSMIKALTEAVAQTGVPMFVGNSLPVRELGMAAGLTDLSQLRCLHQRGAAGIDGVSAGGAGTASVVGPTVVLMGDVTSMHDLHGLWVAGQTRTPLVIAIVANGAGRIFDQLPIGLRTDLSSELPRFNSPLAPDFASLAHFCGARHLRLERANDAGPAVKNALTHPGLTVLELRVDPDSSAQLAASLADVVDNALRGAGLMAQASV